MVKIVVVSDNHVLRTNLEHILEKWETADYFIHCGDSQFQNSDELLTKFIRVRGNNDNGSFVEEELVRIGKYTILVIHGHMQDVINYGGENVQGTATLADYARRVGANMVFYGHTHRADFHYDGQVMVLNPGSTDYPRDYSMRIPTYAVVEFDDDQLSVEFFHAETHDIITRKIQKKEKASKNDFLDFFRKK
ncbi:phosphoesterase [Erysipelotrichaceae bacterium]|nr:phosphoesterase [Erysipelotrichaceae bacterium]